MIRMKPRIDRDEVLREEARRRAVDHCTEHIANLLYGDEAAGVPFREGDHIVIPVVRKRAGATAIRAIHAMA